MSLYIYHNEVSEQLGDARYDSTSKEVYDFAYDRAQDILDNSGVTTDQFGVSVNEDVHVLLMLAMIRMPKLLELFEPLAVPEGQSENDITSD